MQDDKSVEQKIQKTDLEIATVEKHLKEIEKEMKNLVAMMGISEEDLKDQLKKAENSSPEERHKIEAEKKKWDEKIELELSYVDHPQRKQQAFENLRNAVSWIKL